MDFAFCIIRSKANGLAIDVKGCSTNPGSDIIVWRQHGNDNQLWYQDPTTGTVRSKINDFCMDFEGGKVVLNPVKPGDKNQHWELHKNRIRNRYDKDLVLGIMENSGPGALVGSDEFCESETQMWDFEFVGGAAEHMRPQHFYIVSEMNGKVVDIERGLEEEGVKVIMWSRDHEKNLNQLWYHDHQGCIRSALNHMVFHSKDSGKKLKTSYYKDTGRHQWRMEDNRILNGHGECLDIMSAEDEDGARLCSYEFRGSKNQLWRIEYV